MHNRSCARSRLISSRLMLERQVCTSIDRLCTDRVEAWRTLRHLLHAIVQETSQLWRTRPSYCVDDSEFMYSAITCIFLCSHAAILHLDLTLGLQTTQNPQPAGPLITAGVPAAPAVLAQAHSGALTARGSTAPHAQEPTHGGTEEPVHSHHRPAHTSHHPSTLFLHCISATLHSSSSSSNQCC